MVTLRLRRMGKKKQPTYRLVAAEKTAPRDGRFIETLGNYNPRTEPPVINFDEEKVLDWLRKGAKPTNVVIRLLKKIDIWKNFEKPVEEIPTKEDKSEE
ncbi:MAG: 30S ribosomal protein S16 [Candidatus Eremiobacteraeota bacterium]|nr:30S ribosomal protein S16 [Candidatus Eremiobacteraeota bacterium]